MSLKSRIIYILLGIMLPTIAALMALNSEWAVPVVAIAILIANFLGYLEGFFDKPAKLATPFTKEFLEAVRENIDIPAASEVMPLPDTTGEDVALFTTQQGSTANPAISEYYDASSSDMNSVWRRIGRSVYPRCL